MLQQLLLNLVVKRHGAVAVEGDRVHWADQLSRQLDKYTNESLVVKSNFCMLEMQTAGASNGRSPANRRTAALIAETIDRWRAIL